MADVVPYFQAKHRRQEWGFEGPTLELQRCKQIDLDARSISEDHIESLDDEDQYSVQSQSDSACVYLVDLEAYTCDCLSYPLISYCVHLAAVQLHYYEDFELQPLEKLATLPDHQSQPQIPLLSTTHALSEPQDPQKRDRPDMVSISTITTKLESLAAHTHLLPPSYSSKTLLALDHILDAALSEVAQVQVLPKQVKIASNTKSEWQGPNGTLGHMGTERKRKALSHHTDPHGRGERSGKKAKAESSKHVAASSAASSSSRYANTFIYV